MRKASQVPTSTARGFSKSNKEHFTRNDCCMRFNKDTKILNIFGANEEFLSMFLPHPFYTEHKFAQKAQEMKEKNEGKRNFGS